MAGKEIKMTVWALNPDLTLENVVEFMSFNYNKTISYLADRTDLSRHEKTLLNYWAEYEQGRGFSIREMNLFGKNVRYLSVRANFETAASESNAIIGDFLIPRQNRVTHYDEPVYFYEYFGRIYAIVIGSSLKIGTIRKVLMGGKRNLTDEQKRWGRVQTSEIHTYNFASEFFYWLISKQNTEIDSESITIEISDIRAVSQTGSERTDVHHESTGSNLLDEAVPRAGLGINSRVSKIGTSLSYEGGTINLIIFENGECWIDNYFSTINGPNGELIPFDTNLEVGTLILYYVLLPVIKEAYHSERDTGSWTTNHQANSRKDLALGAINELCAENEITLEEIQNLPWFTR